MNVQLPVRLDKSAFLAWVQRREGRFELVEGRVVMMPGASRNHGRIVGNLFFMVRSQLDRRQWDIIAEFGLDSGPETLRYPDIVVDRASGPGSDHTTATPALVIEVLSPSSAKIDLGDKQAEYLRLPSLLAYLVFSQDEPKAWVWLRGDTSFVPGPQVIAGQDGEIVIPALGLDLRLADVYAGVTDLASE